MKLRRAVMCSCGNVFTTPQALWDHHEKEERGIRDDLRGSAWRSLALELGEALKGLRERIGPHTVFCPHNGLIFKNPCDCPMPTASAALAKLTKMKGEG